VGFAPLAITPVIVTSRPAVRCCVGTGSRAVSQRCFMMLTFRNLTTEDCLKFLSGSFAREGLTL
jgi:hypothetical protein